MLRRATDIDTAREVIVAHELAEYGAGAALIERVTEFGSRWVRDVVRHHGGVMARKPRNLLTWFYQDTFRLIHARYAIIMWECQGLELSLGQKLLNAYHSYRAVAPHPGVIDINDFAQIVDLHHRGGAWVRPCVECGLPHLVAVALPRSQVAERLRCPVCMYLSRNLCRGCQMPLSAERGTKHYCETCSPRSVRRALLRKRKAVQFAIEAVQVSDGVRPAGRTAASVRESLRQRRAAATLR